MCNLRGKKLKWFRNPSDTTAGCDEFIEIYTANNKSYVVIFLPFYGIENISSWCPCTKHSQLDAKLYNRIVLGIG